MIRLPHGKTVKKDIDLAEVDLPAAFKTLRQGGFTGYLSFSLQQGSSALVFCLGKVIAALYEDGHDSLFAGRGLEKTFEEVGKKGGRLDIYRLSKPLADQLPIVLGGQALLQGKILKMVDIKAVLARMISEKRTGSLRVYSGNRTTLIFYKDGQPLGFFHDGETELRADANLSMSIAREEGARIDVLVPGEEPLADLDDLLADIAVLQS